MEEPGNQLFFPLTLEELFKDWNRCPGAVPFAGGTQLLRFQDQQELGIPRRILSLDKIEELRRVTRTERYLEMGSMVKLNEIMQLGKIVPEVFIRCLERLGGPQIRNQATIGGNICGAPRYADTLAPLIALEAHYEFRTASSVRWISAARFSGFPDFFQPQELLTRIRIPLEQWDYTLYKKLKPSVSGEGGGGMVFIIRNQKNILADLRLVFAGDLRLRDRNLETRLIGKPLPLDRKDARGFVEQWETYLGSQASLDGFLRDRILNFIETSLLSLSD